MNGKRKTEFISVASGAPSAAAPAVLEKVLLLAWADPACFASLPAKMPTILLAPHCEIRMGQKFLGCLRLINRI